MIVVNGSCISQANMKSLSLRNLNIYFTLTVAIESREVVGDKVRFLGDVGLPLLEMIKVG